MSTTATAPFVWIDSTSWELGFFGLPQRIPWPAQFRGRALTNDFSRKWHGREAELGNDSDAHRQFDAARQAEDYRAAHLYAGQAVALAKQVEPAAAILAGIAQEAEKRLSALCAQQ